MTDETLWRKTGQGAGLIPYIFIDGQVYIFLGRRKTVDSFGKLSLPAGFSDLHLADGSHPEWVETSMSDDCLIHHPIDTAIRETEEETDVKVDKDRVESLIWSATLYHIPSDQYFTTTLFPYMVIIDEITTMQLADTDEMHKWEGYNEQEIHLLVAKNQLAYAHEYEAIKLLFERFRKQRRHSDNLKKFYDD